MDINDRGLGSVVYHLMMGHADARFFPGLNVMVKDETEPGGICHQHHEIQRRLLKQVCAKTDDQSRDMLTAILTSDAEMYRELAVKMFRYGMMMAPMIQGISDPQDDEAHLWNRFWGHDDSLSPGKRAEMSKVMLKDYAWVSGMFDIVDLSGEAPSEEKDKRKEKLFQITSEYAHFQPEQTQLSAEERKHPSSDTMRQMMELVGFLNLISDEEELLEQDFEREQAGGPGQV